MFAIGQSVLWNHSSHQLIFVNIPVLGEVSNISKYRYAQDAGDSCRRRGVDAKLWQAHRCDGPHDLQMGAWHRTPSQSAVDRSRVYSARAQDRSPRPTASVAVHRIHLFLTCANHGYRRNGGGGALLALVWGCESWWAGSLMAMKGRSSAKGDADRWIMYDRYTHSSHSGNTPDALNACRHDPADQLARNMSIRWCLLLRD